MHFTECNKFFQILALLAVINLVLMLGISEGGKMNFEQVMQKINKFVTIDKSDRSVYARDFDNVRIHIFNEMKAVDQAFEKIASSPCLGGSYADNVRVALPDEFDLVIQLQLPDQQLVKITYAQHLPGFVKLDVVDLLKKIEKETHNAELYKKLKTLVDENNYLVQAKFHQWMQSIIANVFKKYPDGRMNIRGITYEFKHSIQGPAQTLDIKVGPRRFSVDFVPALRFPTSIWHAKRQCPIQGRSKPWIAVPKPLKGKDSGIDRDNLYWITSFVDQERPLIDGKQALKPSIRLLKKLRDKHSLTNLKSYYIKTVFLWIAVEKEKENDFNFWNKGLGAIFLYGFEKLLEFVRSGKLPFFWDDRFNMLQKLTPDQKNDISNKLNNVYKLIMKCKDSNPEQLYEIFLTQEEHASLKEGNATIVNEARQAAPSRQEGYCSIM